MLAYDYPILGLFWTMLFVFLWVAWIMLVFRVIIDVFRSDSGGFTKALWLIFVVLVPWLGVLAYVIVNGGDTTRRNIESAQQQQAAVDSYIRQVSADGNGTAAELAKLAELKDSGVLTEAEFAQQKAKLLA